MGGRGHKHSAEERQEVLELIDETLSAGARQEPICEMLGLSSRTVQRWRLPENKEDARRGPKTAPANKLSELEQAKILSVANSPECRDLSPSQIVPILADKGTYLGSESSMYRLLKKAGESAHRERSQPRKHKAPEPRRATGPNQIWSWDITYMKSPIRGMFYYLYLIVDVWSRKVVGASVHEYECNELAAELIKDACLQERIGSPGLVLHSDNGGPMKGASMLATLEELGVVPSFSRPRVSDDNPYSESLFRTLKYRPEYPNGCFESLEASRLWVDSFIQWYNHEHQHSALRFVTPSARHAGEEKEILRRREQVYREAKLRHPERWSGSTRNWSPVGDVTLHRKGKSTDLVEAA